MDFFFSKKKVVRWSRRSLVSLVIRLLWGRLAAALVTCGIKRSDLDVTGGSVYFLLLVPFPKKLGIEFVELSTEVVKYVMRSIGRIQCGGPV